MVAVPVAGEAFLRIEVSLARQEGFKLWVGLQHLLTCRIAVVGEEVAAAEGQSCVDQTAKRLVEISTDPIRVPGFLDKAGSGRGGL